MARTIPERPELIESVAAELADEPHVAAAYVYGSVARGTATPISDVDVAVLLREGIAGVDRGDLQRRLLKRVGRCLPGKAVELRFFDELPIAVRGRVVRDGIRVVDREPPLRVAAEVRTLMEYHDFLHLEREGTARWARAVRERLVDG